jgi:Na+/H+ antiporter NhaA
MRRLSVAMIGLALGCLVGWFVPVLIYPWDTMDLTLAGPEEIGYLFQFFGLCLGGPIGFYIGLWIALNWIAPELPVSSAIPLHQDPRKVEDNLD